MKFIDRRSNNERDCGSTSHGVFEISGVLSLCTLRPWLREEIPERDEYGCAQSYLPSEIYNV